MADTQNPEDKILGDMADAAMYADMRPETHQHAVDAKAAWRKSQQKLEHAKEHHQRWRLDHPFATWLHDRGLHRHAELEKHEDRQKRYTKREVDAYVAHTDAREELTRVEKARVRAEESAAAGLRDLQERREPFALRYAIPQPGQPAREVQPRVEQAAPAMEQPKEQQRAEPTRTVEKADRFTGQLLDSGIAPYQHDENNSDSFFVKLRTDDGKVATHWGKDLGRALSESNAHLGDRLQLAKTGQDQSVEVIETVRDDKGRVVGSQEITAQRRGWSVTNLGAQPEHEHPISPAPSQAQELPVPQQRRSALAERVAALESERTPQQQSQDQGEQGGGRQGGQERPSHSSYYQPVPAGEMAPPRPRQRGFER